MTNKIRAIFIPLISILICTIMSGCGFKPRSPKDIPVYLCILYIDAPNPYDRLTIQLSRTLQALNVHLTKTREEAPIILKIININWTNPIPTILYSSTARFYTYLLSFDFDLETINGKILMGPKKLILRRRLVENANQIYTPNATRLIKEEMTQAMVSLIYKNLVTFPHLVVHTPP